MADPITPEVSQRICTNTNDDHAEVVSLYAKLYSQIEDATNAKVNAIAP